MKPIIVNDDGSIEINDSMSEELKEKIAQYNAFAETPVEEEELSDEEVDAYTEGDEELESDYVESDEVESLEPEVEESSVSQDDLNNLNDLFL